MRVAYIFLGTLPINTKCALLHPPTQRALHLGVRLEHQNNDINCMVRKASPKAEKKPPVHITGGFL
jgi:hypothetical protein